MRGGSPDAHRRPEGAALSPLRASARAFVTTEIGMCSTAPADARATAGVTTAEPCAGTTIPVAPAPSADRRRRPGSAGRSPGRAPRAAASRPQRARRRRRRDRALRARERPGDPGSRPGPVSSRSGLQLGPDLVQPVLRLDGPLGRPDLEHPPAGRARPRARPAGHRRGRGSKPHEV